MRCHNALFICYIKHWESEFKYFFVFLSVLVCLSFLKVKCIQAFLILTDRQPLIDMLLGYSLQWIRKGVGGKFLMVDKLRSILCLVKLKFFTHIWRAKLNIQIVLIPQKKICNLFVCQRFFGRNTYKRI